MDLTLTFVCDNEADRQSANPATARLMVASIRRLYPGLPIKAGLIGPKPDWFVTHNVGSFLITCPDPTNRYANKVECISAAPFDTEHLLFLDGDVLLCNPLDELPFTGLMSGCNTDYPNVDSRIGNVRALRRLFNLPTPTELVPCTVYGEPTLGAINAGVLFFHKSIHSRLTSRWKNHYSVVKSSGLDLGTCNTFLEQMCLMTALQALGIEPTYLPGRYNWNGTIFPSKEDCVFLHYHRPNLLHTDPNAVRVMKDINP